MRIVVEAVGQQQVLAGREVEEEGARSRDARAAHQLTGERLQLEQRHPLRRRDFAHHARIVAVAVDEGAIRGEAAAHDRRGQHRMAAPRAGLANEASQVGAVVALRLGEARRVARLLVVVPELDQHEVARRERREEILPEAEVAERPGAPAVLGAVLDGERREEQLAQRLPPAPLGEREVGLVGHRRVAGEEQGRLAGPRLAWQGEAHGGVPRRIPSSEDGDRRDRRGLPGRELTGPRHAAGQTGAWPGVAVLAVALGARARGPVPVVPALGADAGAELAPQEEGRRVVAPRPAEIRALARHDRDAAAMEDEAEGGVGGVDAAVRKLAARAWSSQPSNHAVAPPKTKSVVPSIEQPRNQCLPRLSRSVS